MVDAAERTPLQAVSKLAFNSDHRLSVVSALLGRRDDMLDKQQVVDATSIPGTSVYRELMDLHALGLLVRTRDGSRVLFNVVEGPFWSWCGALLLQFETSTSQIETLSKRTAEVQQ